MSDTTLRTSSSSTTTSPRKVLPTLYWLLMASTTGLVVGAEPQIVLEQDTWDFGTVSQGRALSHEVNVHNGGDGPLVAAVAPTSCGLCAEATIEPNVIQPGESGSLRVLLNTARLKGRQRKSVTLVSSDPNQRVKKFWVEGIVAEGPKPIIAVHPEVLDLGLILQGTICRASIKIENGGNAPLLVERIHSSGAYCVMGRPDGAISPGKAVEIELSLETTNQKGLVRGYLYVESNDPVSPTKLVEIVSYVVRASTTAPFAGLTVMPSEMGPRAPGRGRLVKRYRIINLLPTEVRMRAPGTPLGADASKAMQGLAPGTSVDFGVEVPASAPSGAAHAGLTLQLPLFIPGQGRGEPRISREDQPASPQPSRGVRAGKQ